ncbi:uncharacterized protein [Kogia breviceps]|uniref:uncharacterized protein isoform X2 n=1 Tax=Kogia breviceps TaxID=27615 RepID=UPI0034D367D1
MRLSVPALRRARPDLFVNYISGSFIALEPPATEKPPPPPQTESRAPGVPASRRPGCDGSAGPEVSGSPTRDLAPEKGGRSPSGRYTAAVRASPAPGLSAPPGRLQLFRMRGGGPEGAGPRMGLRSQEPAGRGIRVHWALGTLRPELCAYQSVPVSTPDTGRQDRILRTTLLLPISYSLRTSRVQDYCEAARKGPATVTLLVEFRECFFCCRSRFR